MPERTYSEEEVADIFARAAERQRPESTRDTSAGLTLAEIELAGREAGFDLASVRAAAAEVDARGEYPAKSKISAAERWVETPHKAGAWEDVVVSLRKRFGTNTSTGGKDTSSLGAAQEWTHTSTSGTHTTVTFSPREEQTLLRVVQEEFGFEDDRIMGWVAAAFVALVPSLLIGGLVAETLALGDLAGIAAVILVMLASLALVAPRVASHVRKGRARQAREVQEIVDELADQIQGNRSQPVASAPSEVSRTRLDLSALDAPLTEAAGPPEQRRVRA